MKRVIFPTLTILIFCFAADASAQKPLTGPAFDLLKRGKYQEAAAALEQLRKNTDYNNNADYWEFLGTAYAKTDKLGKAIAALKKAVDLAPENVQFRANLAMVLLRAAKYSEASEQADNALSKDATNMTANYVRGAAALARGQPDEAIAYSDKVIASRPSYAPAYILKYDALAGRLRAEGTKQFELRDHTDTLRRMLDVAEAARINVTDASELAIVNDRIALASSLLGYASKEKAEQQVNGPAGQDVVPIKILRRTPARYTAEARSAGVQGTIRLFVIFGADEKILGILKLNSLGYGLDEQAMAAASQIKFEPKRIDGKPVTSVVMMEYSFKVY